MTRPPEQPGEDAAGILRAIGSLLVALSGNADHPDVDRTIDEVMERTQPTRTDAPSRRAPDAASARPQEPSRAQEYVPSPEVVREVDFILSDARERARHILDESMNRAESLMRPNLTSVPGIDPRDFEDLRQATHGLTTEIRDVQRRLSRIEALLRASSAARARMDAGLPLGEPDDYYSPEATTSSRTSPEPEAPPAPRSAPPRPFVAPEPRPAPPRSAAPPPPPPPPPPVAEPEPEFFDDEDDLLAETDAPSYGTIPPRGRDGSALDASTDLHPDDLPASAVPRVRSASPDVPRDSAAIPMPPPPASPPPPAPVPERSASPLRGDDRGLGEPPGVYHPEDGALILRVSPVSGFQGLMRVHDAIVRLVAVSQATVEAYSQGEARLRVDLAEEIDPETLVGELGRTLQEPTSIRGASQERRELFITLQ